jgi:DNA-binding NarL/FixJ family response regulator
MKVLLVDDNQDFLTGLGNLLEAAEIDVVGTAHTAKEAVAQARFLCPDVVLMDVMMPGRSGIDATYAIKTFLPSMRVVMMTVSENDAYLFEAIKAGACGYLLKGQTIDNFPEALMALEQGETLLSPGLAAKIMAEFARRAHLSDATKVSPQKKLTTRETAILRQAAEGLTYKQIAQSMDLSERTIKYIFREIADKLHLQNRAQVLANANYYLQTENRQTSCSS